MRHSATSFCLALTLASAAAPVATSSERVVRCGESGSYDGIGEALAAAQPGDSIRVEPCVTAPGGYAEALWIEGAERLEIVAVDGAPVRIDGTAIDGDCATIVDSTDVALVGFELVGCARHGIVVVDSERIALRANRVVAAGDTGILGRASVELAIESNRVERPAGEAIALYDVRSGRVTGNRLPGAGIRLDGGEDTVLVGNSGGPVRLGSGPALPGLRATDTVDRVIAGSAGIDGDFGVGTTDTDRMLDVTGPAAEMEIDSNGGDDGAELVLTSSGGGIDGSWAIKYRKNDGRFTLYRDQDPLQEALSVSVELDLGVGTKTPDHRVDVASADAEVQIDSNGGGDGPELVLTVSDGGEPGSWSLKRRTSDGRFAVVRDQQLANEFLTVLTTGEVGIGEVAPVERLVVDGDARFTDGVLAYGCGTQVAVVDCPAGSLDGPPCDAVPVGAYCEGDGECGTDPSLDNCGGSDWYLKTAE